MTIDFSEQEVSTSRFFNISRSSRRKRIFRPTFELEPTLEVIPTLLPTVEVITFNLPFFPEDIEDWPQGSMGFKLLVECDGSLSFLVGLFLAYFEKN